MSNLARLIIGVVGLVVYSLVIVLLLKAVDMRTAYDKQSWFC